MTEEQRKTFGQINERQLEIYPKRIKSLFLQERKLCRELTNWNKKIEQKLKDISELNDSLGESLELAQTLTAESGANVAKRGFWPT